MCKQLYNLHVQPTFWGSKVCFLLIWKFYYILILLVFVFLLRNQIVEIYIGELIEMLVCENFNSHRTHSKGSRPQFTLGGPLPHTVAVKNLNCPSRGPQRLLLAEW